MSASATTQLFLFVVAFSYLSAFGSLYWQWSGLYGDDGVTPAAIFFEQRAARITTPSTLERLRALPTLAWFHANFGLSVAEFMEAQALAGTLLAALACAGVATAPVLLLLHVLYLSLYTAAPSCPSSGIFCCSRSARSPSSSRRGRGRGPPPPRRRRSGSCGFASLSSCS